MNERFWKDKRVLITGHTGFKGSWLVLWLHALGARLAGFALDIPTRPALFELAELDSLTDTCWGDIRDPKAIYEAVRRFQPEIVFHLAAQALVRESYREPLLTFETNVMGSAYLLQAVRQCPTVRVLVNVTSDKCYENMEQERPYREGDPLGGDDPYSASKACAEIVTHTFRHSFLAGQGLAVATGRAGNVVGGGDWAADRLLPDLFRALLHGQQPQIRNPVAVRPWQHVLEPLSGYLTLAEHAFSDPGQFSGPFNFGPAQVDCRTVGEVVEMVLALWGKPGAYRTPRLEGQPHEATLLRLDHRKATALLGWVPRWRLERALAETVAWFHAYGKGEDSASCCRQQIEAFSSTTPQGETLS